MKFLICFLFSISTFSQALDLQSSVEVIKNAKLSSLESLASGSHQAQLKQKAAAKKLPLEIKLRKKGIVFRLIPAGEFIMGSPESEESRQADEAQKKQSVETAFYMGKFEVTQGQWDSVMGKHSKHTQNLDRNLPVVNVTWHECNEFIAKVEGLEGLPKGSLFLPNDTQWEYACRAGTKSQFYTGEDNTGLSKAAWFYENSGDAKLNDTKWHHKQVKENNLRAHPVGKKIPNAWGLHDTLGNAVEWCSNLHNDKEPRYVTRGGSWRIHSRSLRSAFRNKSSPASRYPALGFRIVLTLKDFIK